MTDRAAILGVKNLIAVASGKGGMAGECMANTFGVPFLGEFEIDRMVRIGGDTCKRVTSLGEDAPDAKSLYAIARQEAARVGVADLSRTDCSFKSYDHGISLR